LIQGELRASCVVFCRTFQEKLMKKKNLSLAMLATPFLLTAPASTLSTFAAPATTTPVAAPSAPSAPAGVNPVAATVNNEKIARADLERLMNAIKERNKGLQAGSDEAKKALQQIRQNMLNQMIEQRLFVQAATTRGIKPNAAEVTKQLQAFKKQVGDAKAWQDFLKSGGKTEADFRRLMGEDMIVQELGKRLVADVKVSDAEITKFYNDNPKLFESPEYIKAHHILFLVKKGTSDADKAKIRARAQDVLKKAQASGADFEALARQYSEEPNAAQSGGDLGAFPRGRMVKAFEDAAFSAQVNKVTNLVETEFGYQLKKK
jgi:peptidyl-prolyl cis-trans isomerase C